MKYRVQFLVEGNRLADVVAAAFGGDLTYDPEMKIWPATQVLPGDVAGIERPTKETPKQMYNRGVKLAERGLAGGLAEGLKRGGNNKSNKRAELLEAALKTGPKRWSEMRAALSDGGLSESSLNNLIGIWKKAGKIRRSEDGLWSLIDGPTTKRADVG
jgi:hypothetical protein